MIEDQDWKVGGLTLDTSLLVLHHRSSVGVALRSTSHMPASDGPVNHRAVSRSHTNMLGSFGLDLTSVEESMSILSLWSENYFAR